MNFKSILESLLFVSDRPLSIRDFSKLLDSKKDIIEKTLEELSEDYKNRNGGVAIVQNRDRYQIVTSPDNSDIVKKFLGDEKSGELTRPQLETLTTIAYRGPITKPELEQIRGVNCSLVLRNLMMRGLIEREGGQDQNQKFLITLDFLKFLGARKVEELPDYGKLNDSSAIDELLENKT